MVIKNNWIIVKNHNMVPKIILSLENPHLTINHFRKHKIKKRNDFYLTLIISI